MHVLGRSMLLWIFILLPGCLPVGDPLGKVRPFIDDLFRLQIDPPDVVLRRSNFDYGNKPPENRDERRAVHLRGRNLSDENHISCENVGLFGFDDWEVGSLRAARARAESMSNNVTSAMHWPNFWDWYSPVLVLNHDQQSFLGTLHSASFRIAYLGPETLISDVIDPATDHLTDEALSKILQFSGGRYQRIYDHAFSTKAFVISEFKSCGEIKILTLEIE